MKALSDHRVLIVNDDGIHAPGIELLEKVVSAQCSDVWIIAPDEEKSGASHQVSMHTPIRVRKLGERRFAIKGSPTDCVLMALHELMDEHPTLVLSGINRGANLGEDAHYSGTMAVAIEAALMGIPSIAFSQVFHPGQEIHWETAEHFTVQIVEKILEAGLPPGSFVNVNFPPLPVAQTTGMQVVSQGRRPPGSFRTDARIDGRQIPYYWIKLVHKKGEWDEGTDLRAIEDGAVSICPLQLDMTDFTYLKTLTIAMDQNS